MFRRKRNPLSPPNPPTFEQIAEDLTTFEVKPILRSKCRTLPSEENGQSNTGEWWKLFETFLSDIRDFKKLNSELQQIDSDLELANSLIKSRSGIIKNQIKNELANIPKYDDLEQTKQKHF